MSRTGYVESRSGMYGFEHALAWLMTFLAILLGAIGILSGYGLLGTIAEEVQAPAQTVQTLQASAEFWDAMVWMLPAVGAGLLAYAFHSGGHGEVAEMTEYRSGMSQSEKWLGYLFALGTIGVGLFGILVGFDVFNMGDDHFDGVLWGFLSVIGGTLTVAMHGIQAADEDYLVTLVERRVRTTGAAPITGGTAETQRYTQ
jgi:hypothetical protein